MAQAGGFVTEDIVPEKVLFDLSYKITDEWRNVARHLNIEEAHIYRIKKDNDDCTQEQIYQVLLSWKKKEGEDATYTVLSRALRQALRKDLADELSSREASQIHRLEYCIPAPYSPATSEKDDASNNSKRSLQVIKGDDLTSFNDITRKIDGDSEDNRWKVSKCTKHTKLSLNKYCVTCDELVCSECAFVDHAHPCEVIKCEEVPQRVIEEKARVNSVLHETKEHYAALEDQFQQRIADWEACRQQIETYILKSTEESHEGIAISKKVLIREIHSKKVSDEMEASELEQSLSEVRDSVKTLRKNCDSAKDSLSDWRKLKETKESAQDILEHLQGQLNELKAAKVDFYFTEFTGDVVCCEIDCSNVVGSVLNQPHRLITIIDRRPKLINACFICADTKSPSKIYWQEEIKVYDQRSPIVMSHVIQWYNDQQHVMFACGRSVFIAHLHLAESVETVSVINLHDLVDKSWITSIYANRPDYPSDEFFISTNASLEIRQYNTLGEVLKKWQISVLVPYLNIITIACNRNKLAIGGRNANRVIIVSTEETIKEIGTLEQSGQEPGFLPATIIMTNNAWLVLWISTSNTNKAWKIAHYCEDGRFIKDCANGKARAKENAPVSITHWKNGGCITFKNMSVVSFKF